jgi:hypothetical protein
MGLLSTSETFRIEFGKDPVGTLLKEGIKLTDADKKMLKDIDFGKLVLATNKSDDGCTGYCSG